MDFSASEINRVSMMIRTKSGTLKECEMMRRSTETGTACRSFWKEYEDLFITSRLMAAGGLFLMILSFSIQFVVCYGRTAPGFALPDRFRINLAVFWHNPHLLSIFIVALVLAIM